MQELGFTEADWKLFRKRLPDWQERYMEGLIEEYKVHELRPHVLHLMRGQVFEIDGKKIFTFGGASSHDISGGILETDDPEFKKKKKALDKCDEPYRINHLTWWEQELATEDEMEEGRNNLRMHDYTVDYIITHCCSSSTQIALGGAGIYEADRQTDYLEFIKNYANYKKWFFGHYHENRNVNEKEILIYEQMIRISQKGFWDEDLDDDDDEVVTVSPEIAEKVAKYHEAAENLLKELEDGTYGK